MLGRLRHGAVCFKGQCSAAPARWLGRQGAVPCSAKSMPTAPWVIVVTQPQRLYYLFGYFPCTPPSSHLFDLPQCILLSDTITHKFLLSLSSISIVLFLPGNTCPSAQVVEPHIVVGDVRRPKTLAAHLQGMDALVILTSAVPRVTRWSALMGSLKVQPPIWAPPCILPSSPQLVSSK